MNKKENILFEKKEINKYGIFGGSRFSKRPKNAFYFHRNPKHVSWKHELKKLEICLELRRKGHNFITEAWRRGSNPAVIRDIVDITTGEIYEIETDPKRAARFEKDPETNNIIVIKLWEEENVAV